MRLGLPRWARKPRGISAFLDTLPPGARLLDAGCGNASPRRIKTRRPDLHYIGLDVGDYNQDAPEAYADRYIVVPPEGFAAEIEGLAGQLDGVISSHNIEHCDDPQAVLVAMCRALRPGGRLYMAFPSAASLGFPRRAGSLNFFDDSTHRTLPDYAAITATIRHEGLTLDFATPRDRPLPQALLGLLLEPLSRARGRTMPGTWQLYGFEAVIWASRPR